MADSLARLIVTLEAQTAQYQKGLENANRQLEKFGKTQRQTLTTVEGGFKRFANSVNTLLRGGGILVGFRTIERELERVAEKFKDTDLGAREFTDALARLGKVTDEKWLSALQLASPIMDAIATAAENAANHVKSFALALGGLAGLSTAAALQALAPEKQPIFSGTISRGFGPEENLQSMLDMEARVSKEAQETRIKDAKRAAEVTAKMNEDLVASRIEAEEKAQEDLNELNERLVQQGAAAEEAIHKDLLATLAEADAAYSQQLNQAELEHLQRVGDQAEAFGDQFADNLVQAADHGFDSVLESWVRTLQQMALKSAAANLFKALFSGAAPGSFMSGVASFFGGGRAGGGPVAAGVPYMVGERGPEMFIPRTSGTISPNGAGGVVINQTIDARGSQDASQLIAAMRVAKNQAIVEVQNARRRGR